MDGDHADLAARLQAGDADVARDLYRSFGRTMFAVAHRVLGNRSLAEDAIQQAFLQAWRARETVDPTRDVRPWLCAIAHRAAIDLARREGRRAHEELDLDMAQPELGMPDPAAGWDAWRVHEAVDGLPAGERDVVRLHHFEGLTMVEIGERLGIPVGTVKSRSNRARRRLMSSLQSLRTVES